MATSCHSAQVGQVSSRPVQAQVINGAFSCILADSVLTYPINVGYAVTVIAYNTGDQLLGPGFECYQPTGQSDNFHSFSPNLLPNLTALPGLQGIQGVPGQTTFQQLGSTVGTSIANTLNAGRNLFDKSRFVDSLAPRTLDSGPQWR